MPQLARTALSLYTGAGGLDYGLEAAGFRIVACVERDKDARATIGASRDWRLAERPDIASYAPSELLDEFSLQEGAIDVLAAGPPCQPFSKAGWWYRDARRLADPRSDTLRMLLDVLEETLPRILLLENVRGFAYRDRDEAVTLIRSRLAALNHTRGTNYVLRALELNSADYGVPQRRDRLFLYACIDGAELQLPEPTHGPGRRNPYRTAWDALGDEIPDDVEELMPSGKWAELLPTIPEGHNYLWHTRRGGGESLFGYRTRYWSFLLKLAKAMPSWTLPATPGPSTGPFHWDSRRLARSELQRLQTFPSDVTVVGSHTSAHRQLGNAVPSAIGELLGRLALDYLGNKAPSGELTLIPGARAGMPPPLPPQPVPGWIRKKHARPHDDHPGKGKGPGAKERAERSRPTPIEPIGAPDIVQLPHVNQVDQPEESVRR
ncbi:DNA cytosine methyltransferase [Solirubrobacter sp. CPCC 204708]|uniref:DNA (cytosine-5-)-methyltransferase n=1 Tax=Solirubrobacter deserti TaxID=2282478 RepID=A0ABT4RD08_9ACTN|nr:DNA cytosine methyltransferase [Solirubrobacter deserti]MBE2317815.1 DNA cytosine methyltransferase [Solirubrobacter deserti]MDA0136408.1 DNA cytosine methyltransferase [Solirubrobacter deserti]